MAKYDKSLVSPTLLLKIGGWRSPIFMVDRIVDLIPYEKPGDRGNITVIKHVSFNEPYITGHFPNNPIMPGVMIAEIFGQAGEYLTLFSDYSKLHEQETGQPMKKFADLQQALANNEENIDRLLRERHRIVGCLASQDVKFKRVVLPGDTIEVNTRLSYVDANGFYHYESEARVGRNVVCTGRIVNFRIEREKAENRGAFLG